MKNSTVETTSSTRIPQDEYDIDFEIDFTFSLTDYVLMALYLVLLLPVELVGRIMSDCYTAYQQAKAHEEKMMPLFLE